MSLTARAPAMDNPPNPPVTKSKARVYGHIPGIPVNTTFNSRKELKEAGVHGMLQAGIHGNSSENGGAFSICVSGRYKDDEDFGDRITYVGPGGQAPDGKQITDQSLRGGSKSLFISFNTKKPVRVIRRTSTRGKNVPRFRYDGLYVVDSYKKKLGKDGHVMCFFGLSKIVEEGSAPPPEQGPSTD